ncbi:reverse transcriptase domain-containing protein [Tanacetum coccineum]
MQGVSKTDFENYVKANDAILRNMQNQGQGSLPSNTVTNPKEDLKGITTRSGVAYKGPTIPITSPKVVERRTEGMDECLALVDLGASINLMPFFVWKKLNLPNLTPTCMTLELADRSISRPISIAKDVNVKVGVFQFLADFVVVDFEPDPRVPLILGRCFLKTSCALIDVYEGELILQVDNEAITYNLDQTSRYLVNYNDMTANRIDVVELACEEYFSGSSRIFRRDRQGILILEALLNSDPLPPPNQGNYLPEIRKELKLCDAKTAKSSIDEPLEVELKDLPPHLKYAFLEDNNKVVRFIIAFEGEKRRSHNVIKSRKASNCLETLRHKGY